MKLYNIPEKSKIYAELSDGSKFLIFDHLDGAYSYCITEHHNIIHLSVGTPLRKYKDGYKIYDKEV